MDDNFKMGLMVLALLAAVIYASAKAMGMDMGVGDAVVQLAADLLRHLSH